MDAELSVKAVEAVNQGFQEKKDLIELSSLEGPFNSYYGVHCPKAEDYGHRKDIIRIFNQMATELFGSRDDCPIVQEFGSFVMDMFSSKSDLDLSINFRDKAYEERREVKIKTLRAFEKKLRVLQKQDIVKHVQLVLSARVPVLKVTNCGTNVECDLSVGNLDGIAKSRIIHMISGIDERFKKLCFLIKAWAKAHCINSSFEGTLNSISLILLVAFHLQTRDPPILPPFSDLLRGGSDPVAVEETISRYVSYGKGNKESVATLFVSLLVMLLSVKELWSMGLCASTYDGSWVYKDWHAKKGGKMAIMSVEDFTDRSQNTARAVRGKKLRKICNCISLSLQQIESFAKGAISVEKLESLLFGTIPSTPQKTKKARRNAAVRQRQKQARELDSSLGKRPVPPSDGSDLAPASLESDRSHPNLPPASRKKQKKAKQLSNSLDCRPVSSSDVPVLAPGSLGLDRSHVNPPPAASHPPASRKKQKLAKKLEKFLASRPISSSDGPIIAPVSLGSDRSHASPWRYGSNISHANTGRLTAHLPPAVPHPPPVPCPPPVPQPPAFAHSDIYRPPMRFDYGPRYGLPYDPPQYSQGFQAPVNHFQAPVNHFPAPVNHFPAPVNRFQAPINTYYRPAALYQRSVDVVHIQPNPYQYHRGQNDSQPPVAHWR